MSTHVDELRDGVGVVARDGATTVVIRQLFDHRLVRDAASTGVLCELGVLEDSSMASKRCNLPPFTPTRQMSSAPRFAALSAASRAVFERHSASTHRAERSICQKLRKLIGAGFVDGKRFRPSARRRTSRAATKRLVP